MNLVKVLGLCALLGTVMAAAERRETSASRRRKIAKSQGKPVSDIEQGRTLGLLRPLLGIGGLGGIYNSPLIATPTRLRPQAAGLQSDYYGGYGGNGGYGGYAGYSGYGGYPIYNIYGGYNGYPQRPVYRPQPAYRPQAVYPSQAAAYPNYGYRPNAGGLGGGYQPPSFGGSAASYNPQTPSNGINSGYPGGGLPPTSTGPSGGASSVSPEQAAQVAHLLGQALGSSLRPLLANAGAGGASAAQGGGANGLANILGLLG